MIYLILSIICSVLIGFIFKLYSRYGVDTLQAIVFNYFTCVGCGWIFLGQFPMGPQQSEPSGWLPYALGLGFVFITGFNSAAQTVHFFGVTVSQIMQKMSILLTVPFAILVYQESGGIAKWTGFALALLAIILVNWSKKSLENEQNSTSKSHLLWMPIITWVLAGVIEITFLWVQGEKLMRPGDVRFISTIFGTAGCIGLSVVLYGWLTRQRQFNWRNIAGGILLGIPNFGSMYFLLKALGIGLEGSLVFPLINVGIILASTAGAVVFFRERLSPVNWLGVALALGAIVLMSGF